MYVKIYMQENYFYVPFIIQNRFKVGLRLNIVKKKNDKFNHWMYTRVIM